MGLTQQDYDWVIVKAETDVLVLEGFLPVTHIQNWTGILLVARLFWELNRKR